MECPARVPVEPGHHPDGGFGLYCEQLAELMEGCMPGYRRASGAWPKCPRASIMKKTGAKSLPALARLALAATWDGAVQPAGSA